MSKVMVKVVTAKKIIQAQRLYVADVPGKVLITTSHIPQVKNVDSGIFKRIRLMPELEVQNGLE